LFCLSPYFIIIFVPVFPYQFTSTPDQIEPAIMQREIAIYAFVQEYQDGTKLDAFIRLMRSKTQEEKEQEI